MSVDPKKLTVSTHVVFDKEDGKILSDEHGKWKSGTLVITLTSGTNFVAKVEKQVSHAKYVAFREDFDRLQPEEVVEAYFPDLAKKDEAPVKPEVKAPEVEEKTEEVAPPPVEEAAPEDVQPDVSEAAPVDTDVK